jgi:hypothetical protein
VLRSALATQSSDTNVKMTSARMVPIYFRYLPSG